MRYLALALALAACFREPRRPPAPPTNKVVVPARERAADDVLAFLPADAEVVVHIDLARARQTRLWSSQIGPLIERVGDSSLDKVKQLCGLDPIAGLDSVSLGLKAR